MSDEANIIARRKSWVTAVNDGDWERYGQLLTEDVVWIPPGLDAIYGRTAVQQWLKPFFHEYEYDFVLSKSRLRVAGNWAVENGLFTSSLRRRESGRRSSHAGRYLVLWRLDGDGTWYIERYVDLT